jgi:Rhodopirellula transposase DDE domain
MQRLVDFVRHYRVTVRLAYYPPYHSKYNPIERCWGILENHWNGTLLDSIDTVLAFDRTMTWQGRHPVVHLVTATYGDGCEINQGRDATGRNSAPAAAGPGQMVCGYCAPGLTRL